MEYLPCRYVMFFANAIVTCLEMRPHYVAVIPLRSLHNCSLQVQVYLKCGHCAAVSFDTRYLPDLTQSGA